MGTVVHERPGRYIGHPVPRLAVVETTLHQRLRLVHDDKIIRVNARLGSWDRGVDAINSILVSWAAIIAFF